MYDGSCSDPFPVKSNVKQGCVLAPTFLGIFFSLLPHAFRSSSDGVYLHTRTDGKLFSIARLRTKTKVSEILVRNMLFAHDTTLASYTEEALQKLIDCVYQSCKDFGVTINIKKTDASAQNVSQAPSIKIDDYTLEAVDEFILHHLHEPVP